MHVTVHVSACAQSYLLVLLYGKHELMAILLRIELVRIINNSPITVVGLFYLKCRI